MLEKLIFDHSRTPQAQDPLVQGVMEFYLQNVPGIEAVIIKRRYSSIPVERKGTLVYGGKVDSRIQEHRIWYAIDLLMNQDASLYLDTENARGWAVEHLQGKRVLNTFAYTGSLGAAAALSGAVRVVQTDRNAKFLALAQETYRLNGLVPAQQDFISGDFFRVTAGLKHDGRLFDLVILDAPFFSTGVSGRVDLNTESTRLINKVRPLVAHNGYLIVVNNALFLSGHEYLASLESTCTGGFMNVKTIIPVPADVSGYAETRLGAPPADPAPFNHSTKIVVLQVFRKDSAVSNVS